MTLPDDTAEEAERLTRRASEAVDPNEADAHRRRRDELLAEHGYTARVREDDDGDTLVLHPSDWLDDEGTVRMDRIDDVDNGVEVSLSGPGEADDWDATERHNRAAADRVTAEHGEVHGRTAHAFADFMGNHYAKPVEAATAGEVREFVEEYFPRNAWPTDEQSAVVEESVDLVRAAGDQLRDGA
ncbi:DUF7108 family protein [Halorarius halobius]|uniref:DUF7108 family protein n=1 Tax=Halorarius halobius TaxID=2962671 RepID=UPI0020CE8EC0|nr:rnhA operon protein [Halorarius halobius]